MRPQPSKSPVKTGGQVGGWANATAAAGGYSALQPRWRPGHNSHRPPRRGCAAPPTGQVLMAHMRHLGDSAQRYRWLGYVSSTSVYGNHEGDWVNEW